MLETFDRITGKSLSRIDRFSGLGLETEKIGGFTIAQFVDKRPIDVAYNDLKKLNGIVIHTGDDIPWEGYVEEVARTSPDEMAVSCLGWSGRFQQVGVRANQAPGKCSTFLNDVMFADTDITDFISAGDIETETFSGPAIEDIRPYKNYQEIIDQYNEWYDWRPQIWEDKKFDWKPPQTSVKWIVADSDSPGFSVTETAQNFFNHVPYSYSAGGSHKAIDDVEDAASILECGRRISSPLDIPGRCSPADAAAIAAVYLNRGLTTTVVGEIRTKRVFTANLVPVIGLWQIRAGDIIRVMDYLPTEVTIADVNAANEITTFEIHATRYLAKEKEIQISPTEWASGIDVSFAKLEAGLRGL